MQVLETKVLRGPNYWSIKRQKLIQLTLDLGELEHRPTDTIPGFAARIERLLPSLYEHRCSEGVAGGFFQRVRRGTWMGHVIEHIAIAIQNLAGISVGFGQTRGTGKQGIYHVVFEYGEEAEGRYAASAAVRIAEALIKCEDYDLQEDIFEIKKLWYDQKPGPSTGAIVAAAASRGIPCVRLDEEALVQLGHGCRQKRIEATITSCTNSIAVDIACDKDRTKRILTEANIPVPRGDVVCSVEKLQEAIESIGYPVVLKPLDGNHGKGATIDVRSWDEALVAFERAREISCKIIVERFIRGRDYRVLLVNGRFVAAALRTPAAVTGDGRHTIRELIRIVNADPRRGNGHDNVLTCIEVNDVCLDFLAKHGYSMDTVLPLGQACFLKPTANLSTGGTATDVTDDVHPRNVSLFERVARAIGLDVCGIDVMAPDLSTPLRENGGAVLEVNAAPGFRMHLEPTMGQPRDVAGPVVDMLFPYEGNGRIPIVAVTGTNGKTTTTRLMAYMAQQSGCIAGYTTTDGVYIDGELVLSGDCSGPRSAQFVLKDSAVEFAVLETARGGILRSGLGYDRCSAAIVTNVAEDHLGLDGIDSIEKLARVKSVVPETVLETGYAILNADDDLVYAMRENLSCKVALFSLHADSLRIETHCAAGGLAAYLENGYLILRIGNHIVPIEEVSNVPLTYGGRAVFNVANVLAASLGAYVSNIKLSTIRKALQTFLPSGETTPGRINLFEFNDLQVLVDYAHNPHGVKALGQFIKTFDADHKVGIITGVGDRRDEDIIALAEEAARVFDEIVIRHDEDMRGRSREALDRLLTEGVRRVDARKPISYRSNECEAVEHAVRERRPRSLVVVLIENFQAVTSCIRRLQEEEQAAPVLRRAV